VRELSFNLAATRVASAAELWFNDFTPHQPRRINRRLQMRKTLTLAALALGLVATAHAGRRDAPVDGYTIHWHGIAQAIGELFGRKD